MSTSSHEVHLWLRLTGGEGVKEILQTTRFACIVDKVVLKQMIQTRGVNLLYNPRFINFLTSY